MSSAIKVENISKIYRLGEIGTGTLSQDVHRWWVTKVLGKEDPFLKIGQVNNRAEKGDSNVVYSLRDITFEVPAGQAVGIIGKNGAGKSTLLKILSRVTSPTTGKISVKGRVASLLEVGTGFHPELTGRENIFLNGAILGMRRHEIKSKLDEIIDFSGVERYIDTPVKRYSSGMYVRLAFAVAAHLESEILVVDEVLAVGDAEFQKKCLGKMGDVSNQEGRTILFVSHNLNSIKNLCPTTILLENGLIKNYERTENVIESYLESKQISSVPHYDNPTSTKPVFLKEAYLTNAKGEKAETFSVDEDIHVRLYLQKNAPLRGTYLHFTVVSADGTTHFETDSIEQKRNTIDTADTGTFLSLITIPRRIINTGKYFLNLGIASKQAEKFQIESLESFLSFQVIADTTHRDPVRRSLNSTILEWTTELI